MLSAVPYAKSAALVMPVGHHSDKLRHHSSSRGKDFLMPHELNAIQLGRW